ncbi:ABC transporter substrate-binding protein [Pannus brasiliensis]
MSSQKAGLPPIFYLFAGLLLFILVPKLGGLLPLSGNDPRVSTGALQLDKNNTNPDKERAIAAIAKGDTKQGEEFLQKSLARDPNDPESVIYLNNLQTGDNPLKIAVVVPVGNNSNIAREMLRGVASAQGQINAQGGINGRKLAVTIVNDDNNPDIAREMAGKLVQDPDIVAVIGHNASDASLAAAPVYQKGGLVMVSPTSFANNLSGAGNYIFRVVPPSSTIADALGARIVNTAKIRKIAFCYDSQAADNVSFKDELMASVAKKGGQIVPIVCDVTAPNFDASDAVEKAISAGATGLFVSAHVDRLDPVFKVIQADRGRLALFSSPTLYNIKTLQEGGEAAKGLTLVAPWHPSVNPTFANQMKEQWRGPVSWRTATSFDTTKTIAAGLKQNPTRGGLQSVLRSPNFRADGATGTIRFDPGTGDRVGQPVLLQVQPSSSGYQFVSLPR